MFVTISAPDGAGLQSEDGTHKFLSEQQVCGKKICPFRPNHPYIVAKSVTCGKCDTIRNFKCTK